MFSSIMHSNTKADKFMSELKTKVKMESRYKRFADVSCDAGTRRNVKIP